METKKVGHSKIEFKLKIGDKHEVVVLTSAKKDEAKQVVALKMLKILYPQFEKYGSILRIYDFHVKQRALKDLRKEQKEFQNKNFSNVGVSKSRSKRIGKNPEFINAVRNHMLKFAVRAKKAKNSEEDLIYSTMPLPKDEVKGFEETCKNHNENHGATFWNKIPKL